MNVDVEVDADFLPQLHGYNATGYSASHIDYEMGPCPHHHYPGIGQFEEQPKVERVF